jgi:LysM repeat protein
MVYTVKSGDTLSKIGLKHGVDWKTIYEANKSTIKNPNVIYPGQKISIPTKSSSMVLDVVEIKSGGSQAVTYPKYKLWLYGGLAAAALLFLTSRRS